MIESVILDWDGVVVDSGDCLRDAYRDATRRVLGDQRPVTVDDELLARNVPARDLLALWTSSQSEVGELEHELIANYKRRCGSQLRLRLGAEHGLALLKTRRDLTFLAVTSKSQELVDADLAALGLGSPRVVVAVDAWGIGTAPRDLTVVCSEQRLSTDSSVFVCDHPRDVIEAHAAGLTAAVLANGHPVEPSVLAEQPEHVLATLADLPPMLG